MAKVKDLTKEWQEYQRSCHPDDRMDYTDFWENVTGKRYPFDFNGDEDEDEDEWMYH